MSTPAEIIALIDTAIAEGAEKPLTITHSGRTITYRTLNELIEARKYYAKLAATSQMARPFTISHLKAGGPRS